MSLLLTTDWRSKPADVFEQQYYKAPAGPQKLNSGVSEKCTSQAAVHGMIHRNGTPKQRPNVVSKRDTRVAIRLPVRGQEHGR